MQHEAQKKKMTMMRKKKNKVTLRMKTRRRQKRKKRTMHQPETERANRLVVKRYTFRHRSIEVMGGREGGQGSAQSIAAAQAEDEKQNLHLHAERPVVVHESP